MRQSTYFTALLVAALFFNPIESAQAQLPPSTRGPFPTYHELTAALEQIHSRAPNLVSMTSLAETPEGRSVWLVTVAARRDERALEHRPAFLANGTHHASELAGTLQSLRLIEHLIENYDTDDRVTQLLDEQVFYVVPRVAVDGAEHVLSTLHRVRSRFVDIPQRNVSRPQDLNGDGMILTMRWQDPDGDLVASTSDPRLLVERRPGDPGPYYRQTTEGLIHDWDSKNVRRSQMRVDFNRTYPFDWAPFHSFLGHKRYPLGEVETKAMADFVISHPNIIHAHDYHTGSPVVWYPGSFFEGTEQYDADDKLHERIGSYGADVTGYPYYPGYAPSHARIPGFYSYWMYEHQGVVAYTVELGVMANYIDLPAGTMHVGRDDEDRRLLRWQEANPEYDLFIDWEEFKHPQLGDTEIGGWNYVLRSSAPPDEIENVMDRVIDFALHQASFAPKVTLYNEHVEELADGLYKIAVAVRNAGTLATSGTRLGADVHPGSEPLATISGADEFIIGSELVSLRHLEAGQVQHLEWIVRSSAENLEVKVESPRGLFDRISLPLR